MMKRFQANTNNSPFANDSNKATTTTTPTEKTQNVAAAAHGEEGIAAAVATPPGVAGTRLYIKKRSPHSSTSHHFSSSPITGGLAGRGVWEKGTEKQQQQQKKNTNSPDDIGFIDIASTSAPSAAARAPATVIATSSGQSNDRRGDNSTTRRDSAANGSPSPPAYSCPAPQTCLGGVEEQKNQLGMAKNPRSGPEAHHPQQQQQQQGTTGTAATPSFPSMHHLQNSTPGLSGAGCGGYSPHGIYRGPFPPQLAQHLQHQHHLQHRSGGPFAAGGNGALQPPPLPLLFQPQHHHHHHAYPHPHHWMTPTAAHQWATARGLATPPGQEEAEVPMNEGEEGEDLDDSNTSTTVPAPAVMFPAMRPPLPLSCGHAAGSTPQSLMNHHQGIVPFCGGTPSPAAPQHQTLHLEGRAAQQPLAILKREPPQLRGHEEEGGEEEEEEERATGAAVIANDPTGSTLAARRQLIPPAPLLSPSLRLGDTGTHQTAGSDDIGKSPAGPGGMNLTETAEVAVIPAAGTERQSVSLEWGRNVAHALATCGAFEEEPETVDRLLAGHATPPPSSPTPPVVLTPEAPSSAGTPLGTSFNVAQRTSSIPSKKGNGATVVAGKLKTDPSPTAALKGTATSPTASNKTMVKDSAASKALREKLRQRVANFVERTLGDPSLKGSATVRSSFLAEHCCESDSDGEEDGSSPLRSGARTQEAARAAGRSAGLLDFSRLHALSEHTLPQLCTVLSEQPSYVLEAVHEIALNDIKSLSDHCIHQLVRNVFPMYFPNLSSIDVIATALTDRGLEALEELFTTDKNKQRQSQDADDEKEDCLPIRLKLADNNVSPAGIKKLLAAAATTGRPLEQLHLGGNPGFGDEGAAVVAEFVSRQQQQQPSFFAGSSHDGGHSGLAAGGCGFRVLSLRRTSLTACGVEHLCAMGLVDNCMLSELCLRENPLGPEGIIKLAAAIRSMPSLTDLNLKRVEMDDSSASKLFDALTLSSSRLRALCLAENDMKKEAAAGLGCYLEFGAASLTSLDLSENRLDPQSMAVIANGIRASIENASCTLYTLVLSGNDLGTMEAVNAVAQMMCAAPQQVTGLLRDSFGSTVATSGLTSGSPLAVGSSCPPSWPATPPARFSPVPSRCSTPPPYFEAHQSQQGAGASYASAASTTAATATTTTNTTLDMTPTKTVRTMRHDPSNDANAVSALLPTEREGGGECGGASATAPSTTTSTFPPRCPLLTLRLQHCSLQGEGFAALCNSLCAAPCRLRTIVLKQNYGGAIGSRALADAIMHNSSLMRLEFNDNEMDLGGMQKIADALETSPCSRLRKIVAGGQSKVRPHENALPDHLWKRMLKALADRKAADRERRVAESAAAVAGGGGGNDASATAGPSPLSALLRSSAATPLRSLSSTPRPTSTPPPTPARLGGRATSVSSGSTSPAPSTVLHHDPFTVEPLTPPLPPFSLTSSSTNHHTAAVGGKPLRVRGGKKGKQALHQLGIHPGWKNQHAVGAGDYKDHRDQDDVDEPVAFCLPSSAALGPFGNPF